MIHKIYTIEEVAKTLKISERTAWRYVKSGKLKAVRLSPRIIRFTEKNIQDFLKKK